MGLDVNSEPDTDWLRYSYTSLTTPPTTYELNTNTGERRLLKRQPVIGYDPANYVTERLWATARDGTRVPVSLVYRKGFKKDGTAALLQYGYGSYGSSMDPASTCRWSACSTAASSTPSRTSAAARKWAAPGTTTASCCTRRTPSPTSSTSPISW